MYRIEMYGLLIASVVYWLSLLAVFMWLNRMIVALKARVAFLEAGQDEKGGRKGER